MKKISALQREEIRNTGSLLLLTDQGMIVTILWALSWLPRPLTMEHFNSEMKGLPGAGPYFGIFNIRRAE